MATSGLLITAAKRLRDAVAGLRYAAPVTHVYNPLIYAWRAHEMYLRRYGNGRKRVLFLGMNPGPLGWRKPVCRSVKSLPCAIGSAFKSELTVRLMSIRSGRCWDLIAHATKSAANAYGD